MSVSAWLFRILSSRLILGEMSRLQTLKQEAWSAGCPLWDKTTVCVSWCWADSSTWFVWQTVRIGRLLYKLGKAPEHVYQVPRPAVTNCCKLGGLQQRKGFITSLEARNREQGVVDRATLAGVVHGVVKSQTAERLTLLLLFFQRFAAPCLLEVAPVFVSTSPWTCVNVCLYVSPCPSLPLLSPEWVPKSRKISSWDAELTTSAKTPFPNKDTFRGSE